MPSFARHNCTNINAARPSSVDPSRNNNNPKCQSYLRKSQYFTSISILQCLNLQLICIYLFVQIRMAPLLREKYVEAETLIEHLK